MSKNVEFPQKAGTFCGNSLKIAYDEAVDVMSAVKVVDGYANGSFNPKATLTRGAAAKIICNLILGPTTASALTAKQAPYKDVPADHTFAGYIAYCKQQGIISGYEDQTFRPAATLTSYAFMKMLLGALGYDSDIEGYVGPNWSIQVAKRALSQGLNLNKGLDGNFVGTKPVTREEACLYAFNTLQSTMVGYDTKTSVKVDGAEVVIAGSEAKEMKAGATKEYKTPASLNDGKLQFCEMYFPKLSYKSTTDDFDRPAHTWLYKNDEIGTYVNYDLMVGEFTQAVTGKDLYNLLGSANIKAYADDVTYYVDGKDDDTIKASNMIKTNTKEYDTTGNGALTQVFVDDDAKSIVIVTINTYFANVVSDYNSKKESVVIEMCADAPVLNNATLKLDDFSNIESLKEDDKVMVTMYEGTNGKYEIATIAVPEMMADQKITKYSEGNYLVAGEQYDYAKNGTHTDHNELGQYNSGALKDKTYDIYLDQYGYVLAVLQHSGKTNYLFLTGYDFNGSNLANRTATANAIFLDGTMQEIEVNVTETNKKLSGTAPYWNLKKGGESEYNAWFTYTTAEKNGKTVYTLDDNVGFINTATTADTSINPTHVKVTSSSKVAYGNDDSVYITVEPKTVSDTSEMGIAKVNGTYTGVQNIDLTLYGTGTDKFNLKGNPANENASARNKYNMYTLYDVAADKYIIGAVVIGKDVTSTLNYGYAVKGANKEYVDGDFTYWDFTAVVDGGVKTLTVKTEYTDVIDSIKAAVGASNIGVSGLFNFEYDKDGYVVAATPVKDSDSEVYGNDEFRQPIDEKTKTLYNVEFWANNSSYSTALTAGGNTLYTALSDQGLTVLDKAPIVVIQRDSKGDLLVNEYSGIKTAVNALEDKDHFKGWISAGLDKSGRATWVVLKEYTEIDVKTEDDTISGTGDLTLSALTNDKDNGQLKIDFISTKAITSGVATVTITNADGVKIVTEKAVDSISTSADAAGKLVGSVDVPYAGAVGGMANYKVDLTIKEGSNTYTVSGFIAMV